MKYISFFTFCLIILFTGCSSKEEIKINEKINSFSLDKNIPIGSVPKTVKSPFSINLGLGGYISKHVGIHMGTSVRPNISNDDALNLQKGIALHHLSLGSLIQKEFSRQMTTDNYYKHKFVPFGADYKIHLFIPKYEFDDSLFSSKSHVKIYMEMKILNKNDNVIYSNSEVNTIDSSKVILTQGQILNSKENLEKVLNESISNVIAKLIYDLKRN